MITNTPYFEFIQATILKELDEAEEHVIVAVSWLTDRVLFHKLYSLCRKGKRVDLLLNYDSINLSCGLDFEKIVEAGGRIYWEYESDKQLMHNKYCLIDNHTIITGSYNWTNKAKLNNENIIVIKNDSNSILKFKDEFRKLTKQKDLVTTDTFSLPVDLEKSITSYSAFLEWWENGYVELRIAITERLFKREYDFNVAPNHEEYDLLMKTTALDLEFIGNLLIDYKSKIQKQFNDYSSFEAEYGYTLSTLIGIEKLQHLEYLNCSWNDLSNIKPLAHLKNLSYLDLSFNERSKAQIFEEKIDLTPLASLQKLEYLNLASNKNLVSLEAINYLKSLKTLDLSETNASEIEIDTIKSFLPNCEILLDSIHHSEEDEDSLSQDDVSQQFDDDLPF